MKSLLSKDEKTKLLETFRSSGQTQAAFARSKRYQSKDTGKMDLPAEAWNRTESEQCWVCWAKADSSKNQTGNNHPKGRNRNWNAFVWRIFIEWNPESSKRLMKFNFEETKIYVRPGATDLRKEVGGLLAVIENEMKLDALTDSVFLFCNKSHKLLKLIFWDKTGFWLAQKRLERNTWPCPDNSEENTFSLMKRQ